MAANDPVIQFDGYRINKLHYDTISETIYNKKFADNKSDMDVSCALDYKSRNGSCIITCSIGNSIFGYRQLHLEVVGAFSLRQDISERDAKKYIATNGAAMLYPYVRTIVSVVTSLDSPKVNVLPSLNFLDAYNESQHD